LFSEGRNLRFDVVFLSDIERDGEDHCWLFVFWEKVGDGLDELEIEVFYSALVFFDFGWSGSLFDDRAESSFGDDEGLVGKKCFEGCWVEGFGDVLFEKLENRRIGGFREISEDFGRFTCCSSFGVFQSEVEFDVGADEVVAEGIGEKSCCSGSAEGVSDENSRFKIPRNSPRRGEPERGL
jgi:hypothetical protein